MPHFCYWIILAELKSFAFHKCSVLAIFQYIASEAYGNTIIERATDGGGLLKFFVMLKTHNKELSI